MIETHLEIGKSYLFFRASGAINAKEFIEGMGKFEQLVTETQPKGLLIDWTDLAHWGAEAEDLRFIARIEQRARFERVAVIASSAWEAECNRFQEIMNCPVRRFSPSARRSAEAWLEAV